MIFRIDLRMANLPWQEVGQWAPPEPTLQDEQNVPLNAMSSPWIMNFYGLNQIEIRMTRIH